jgi:predicted nucleic acid-binding protein
LIALSILDWLDLPRHFFDPIIIPEAVVNEATGRGFTPRGAREIANGIETGWIHVASPVAHELLASLSDDLGIGESEAIVLAVEPKAVLLIDDPSGRRRARQLDVQITGTLGLLALAKHSGRIPAVSSWVLKLQEGGYHLSERLIEKFLTDMGERPASKEHARP